MGKYLIYTNDTIGLVSYANPKSHSVIRCKEIGSVSYSVADGFRIRMDDNQAGSVRYGSLLP